MPKSSSPKKTDSSKKKSKKEEKAPAKNLREYTIAKGLDKRLVPTETKRTGRKPSRFTEVAPAEKEEKEVVIPKGKGKKLDDTEHIADRIAKRPNKNELLQTIHNLIFGGRVTKKTSVKDNLLAFKGIVYEEGKEREYWEDRLAQKKKKQLQDISAFFGLDPKKDKEDLAKQIVDFLESPVDSDEVYPISDEKKRKRSRSRSRSRSASPARKKKAKKDPNAPKRPKSSYMFFVKDNQKRLAGEHPNEGVTDIAKRLGKEWKKLGADDKVKFEKLAKKDKKRYEEEKAKYVKSK